MSLFDNFLRETVGESSISARALWRDDFNMTNGPTQSQATTLNFAALPAVRKHQVISGKLQQEMAYLMEWDRCQYCQGAYQRIDNLGTHRCAYHPQPTTNPYTYGCCGVSKQNPGTSRRGCTPCDHSPFNPNAKPLSPRWTKETVFTRVPKAGRHLLRFPASSIVGEETNPHDPIKSFILVTRVRGYTPADI